MIVLLQPVTSCTACPRNGAILKQKWTGFSKLKNRRPIKSRSELKARHPKEGFKISANRGRFTVFYNGLSAQIQSA